MKPLDIINCVDFGYRTLWQERHYFMRLAAAPLAVKVVCLGFLVGMGWQNQYLRMALVMLPSFFAEGWMLAHVCRLVFLDQRWPFNRSGNAALDGMQLAERAYGITAGTLFYVVIKFLMSGFLGVLMAAQASTQSDLTVAQAESNPGNAGPAVFFALAFVFLTVWGFRFVFLYIPVAAGLGTRVITHVRKGMAFSLQAMGVWLICFLPLALVARYCSSAFVPATGEPGQAGQFIIIVIQSIIDTMIGITVTAALAAGLRDLLKGKPSS